MGGFDLSYSPYIPNTRVEIISEFSGSLKSKGVVTITLYAMFFQCNNTFFFHYFMSINVLILYHVFYC